MDEMLNDFGKEFATNWSEQHTPPEEVQKFYRLLEALYAKVHEDTDVTVLQAVTCLMTMKIKTPSYGLQDFCILIE